MLNYSSQLLDYWCLFNLLVKEKATKYPDKRSASLRKAQIPGTSQAIKPKPRLSHATEAVTDQLSGAADTGLNTWHLPKYYRSSALQDMSREEVLDEFADLDLTNEGKLRFFSLRNALDLKDALVDDEEIKRWLRETDRSGKGYVDTNDYLAAYGFEKEPFAYEDDTVYDGFKGSYSLPQDDDLEDERPLTSTQQRALLKQAFSKFDIDRDGFISVGDLRNAFEEQGMEYSDSDLIAWVKRRDQSDIGAVGFEDFSRYFKK